MNPRIKTSVKVVVGQCVDVAKQVGRASSPLQPYTTTTTPLRHPASPLATSTNKADNPSSTSSPSVHGPPNSSSPSHATTAMSEGYYGKRTEGDIAPLLSALITAHHVLHARGVLDAFGHVSVRNPDNPTASFWLPHNCPPALLAGAEDLVEYRIEDGACVEKGDEEGREHFAERYLHSEVYKRFEGVNAVVHSHCGDVLPYCVGGVTLKPLSHMAGFLGSSLLSPSLASPLLLS